MSTLKYFSLFILLLIISCGRDDDSFVISDVGYLRQVDIASETKTSISTDNFIVSIHRESDSSRAYSALKSAYPDLYELEIGDYFVEAIFPSDENYKLAAMEQPRFFGSTSTFEIKPDQVTECPAIECSLLNMQVIITYGDLIKEQFEDYRTEVYVVDEEGNKHSLIFQKNTTTVGWFEPIGPLYIKFSGVRKEIEEEVVWEREISENIAKGYCHKLNINGTYESLTSE